MTTEWYRVVRSEQGYGWFSPEAWAAVPAHFRELFTVLQLCDTVEGARAAFAELPQEWVDVPVASFGGEQ